jgi:hypothetical protein
MKGNAAIKNQSPSMSPSFSARTQNNCTFSIDDIRKVIREEVREIISALRTEIETVHEEVGRVNNRLRDLEETLMNVKSTQHSHQKEIESIKAAYADTQKGTSIEGALSELEDRFNRRSNLIISGLPEPVRGNIEDQRAADDDSFAELLKSLDVNLGKDSRIDLRRLGKSNGPNPRILKVTFNKSQDRDSILRRSKLLRQTKYKNVFINKDLTVKQQKDRRVLIEELKTRRALNEDVLIRGDKVVLRCDLEKLDESPHFRKRF